MEILWLAASYFLGSIPSAYIVARAFRGIDIRRYGSGNVGGANVWAQVSFWAFLLVGFADGAKGAIAVEIGRRLGLDPWALVAAGWAAMAGHNWSIFLRGAGGKGIATALGALIVLSPIMALALFLTLVLGHFLKNGATVALFALGGLPLFAWASEEPIPVVGYTLGAFLLHLAKRLLGITPPWELSGAERRQVLIYRLFFDRDTRRHEDWVYRKPEES